MNIAKKEQMKHYYLKAKAFLLPSGLQEGGYLEIVAGKFGRHLTFAELPADAKIKDLGEAFVAPGLVETHLHGYLGHDVMDASKEGLAKIGQGLLACGVTSYLPTTLTAPKEKLAQVCRLIAQEKEKLPGAKIQGIYFEGPYFTTEHKGAQDPSYMRAPSLAEFTELQTLAHGAIKKIALAPERKGTLEFIQGVVQTGCRVCLGHSAASYEQGLAAVDAGASIFTHTYNGMSGLAHRAPGLVGAAFETQTTYAELICDGHHVHPGAVGALIKAKGPQKVVLITDCMRAGGMPPGDYHLGEFPVTVSAGMVRLKSDHSLAGSVLELFTAVKNLIMWGKASIVEAFLMASYVPALSVGLTDVCGSLTLGHPADFIVVSPTLELEATYLDGHCVYQK